ncbi:MAG TPA: PilZ domain-containing protein [Microvirga sp.]|jgi:hypothetical protein|nr:PilZ domain-containing protein [Microvirga sp.]
MDYRRNAERVATSLLGVVDHENSLSTCLVTDLSAQGARLRVSASHALPETFRLLIARTGLDRQAEVRWRTGEEVGIEFRQAAKHARGPERAEARQ